MTRDGHTLVLGMGNAILSDDAVGLVVAQRLRQLPMPDGVVVEESEAGGLRLVDLVRGFTKLIIVDALQSGRPAGEVVRLRGADFPGNHRSRSAHCISLATTMELGRRLGYPMPGDVVVYGVEALDVETFGEQLSEPVARATDEVVARVLAEVGAEAVATTPGGTALASP